MGFSTDAILFYGVDLGENCKLVKNLPIFKEEDGSEENLISEQIGELLKLKGYFNTVFVRSHGYVSHTNYFLASKIFSTWKRFPEIIGIDDLKHSSKDLEELLKILEIKEEPKWYLVSSWG